MALVLPLIPVHLYSLAHTAGKSGCSIYTPGQFREVKDVLKNEFGINACDMETAAIAYVANLTGTPFASLRRVSDDAGEDATEDYHEMNNRPMSDLPELLLKSVNCLFHEEVFWK